MPTAVIEVDTQGQTGIVASSLRPEVKVSRATVSLTHTDTVLVLKINAEDSVSLRAACNSFLRWVEVAMKVQELVNQCK